MSYGARCERTANHTNCKGAMSKITWIAYVAGYKTNLSDGPVSGSSDVKVANVEDITELYCEDDLVAALLLALHNIKPASQGQEGAGAAGADV